MKTEKSKNKATHPILPSDFKTIEVSDFLDCGISRQSWFVDDSIKWIRYRDRRGRTWRYCFGTLKPEIKTNRDRDGETVDLLGGMNWKRRGDFFVCCYRDETPRE